MIVAENCLSIILSKTNIPPLVSVFFAISSSCSYLEHYTQNARAFWLKSGTEISRFFSNGSNYNAWQQLSPTYWLTRDAYMALTTNWSNNQGYSTEFNLRSYYVPRPIILRATSAHTSAFYKCIIWPVF